MAICLNPDQDDFRGYPVGSPWTETKTQQFQRNNCGGGQTGSWVTYSKTYSSDIDENDLQQQITNDAAAFNVAGQAYANSNGTCSSSCQASSYAPVYNFFAMSSSQVWLNGISNSGVLAPYTKSTVLSSAALPNHVTLNNNNIGGYFWKTAFPHNSNQIGYQPYIIGSALFMRKREYTVGDACSSSTPYIVGALNSVGGVWVDDFYMVDENKAIILVGYKQGSGQNFDIWYWEAGVGGTVIYTIERPKNSKYSATAGAIAYDGTNVYYMVGFHSRNSDKRTFAALFRTELSQGISNTTSKISNWSYSNKGVRVACGGYAGNKVFFLYTEDGDMKVQNVLGTTADAPDSMSYTYGAWSYMRDPYSTNDCYFGSGVATSGSAPRLVRYNASSNTWTVINNS